MSSASPSRVPAPWPVSVAAVLAAFTLSCGNATGSGPPEDDVCRIPPAPSLAEVDLTTNVTYAVMGGQPLKLDVAAPPEASGRRPMVLALHGGSWHSGSKTDLRETILRLAGAGYVAASADYRLVDGGENRFPAAVADVRCAVRWLKASARSLGGDPGRVVALGTSAGGHLASMLATAPEVVGLDGAGDCPVAGDPSVDGAASFYGVYDVRGSAPGVAGSPELGSLIDFLGGHPDDVPAIAAAASPVVHLDPADPPFLLSYGTADQVAFQLQAEAFADSLAARGGRGTLVTVSAGHGYRPFSEDPALEASSCALEDFLDDLVGPP